MGEAESGEWFPSLSADRARCVERFGFDPEESLAAWIASLTGDASTTRRLLTEGALFAVGLEEIEPPVELSPAEYDILRLIARGLTDKEIAEVRVTAFETVKSQARDASRRLLARNRAHAAALFALLEAADLVVIRDRRGGRQHHVPRRAAA